MGEFTSLLEYYQPVFDTYGINEKNKRRLIFRLATIHFFIAVCPRLTGCRKIVELCLTALYVYSPKEGGKGRYLAGQELRRRSARGWCESDFRTTSC